MTDSCSRLLVDFADNISYFFVCIVVLAMKLLKL